MREAGGTPRIEVRQILGVNFTTEAQWDAELALVVRAHFTTITLRRPAHRCGAQKIFNKAQDIGTYSVRPFQREERKEPLRTPRNVSR